MSKTELNDSEGGLSLSSEELRRFRRLSVTLTIVAMTLFVASVYLYSAYGGPWVDSLDERIGEIVARRAQNMKSAGQTEDAITLFQDALILRFDDPMQRQLASKRFAELLIEEGRFSEAAHVARSAVSQNNARLWYNFNLLCTAHERGGDIDDAILGARDWLEATKEANEKVEATWASHRLGLLHETLGQTEEALAAHLEGYTIHSSVENGLEVARILVEQDRAAEALPYLNFILEAGPGWRAEEARELLMAIEQNP